MTDDAGKRLFGLSPRCARWVLGVSLAVNFLMLGLAGGAALKMGDHGSRGGRYSFTSQIVEAAGPDRRDAVRAILDTGRREDWREAMRGRWEDMATLIAAKPFEAAALGAALDASDARRAASRRQRNDATVEALALLTDEERAALSGGLRENLKQWAKRH
ncbi:MAG: periplasmic heavy metal sensor [Paracoccaceae bacterium]